MAQRTRTPVVRGTPPPAGATPGSIGAEWITHQLRANEQFARARSIHLEIMPGNPERRDFGSRASFTVFRDREPFCFLTIGRNLSDLWRRTKGFAEACPKLACRPLFHRKSGPWELIAVEFFRGVPLENRVMDGSMGADEALAIAQKAMRALEATRKPSNIESAARELDRFAERLMQAPLFSGFDQGFLRDVVLPFIRHGALAGRLSTRWTNGDFIARNLLVDTAGDIRLIDHEFAGRTHFDGEDWWRWRTFSRLPAELRDLPGLRGASTGGDWLEVYFILRQFSLANAINGAHLAVADAQAGFERIAAIIATQHAGFRSSVFLAAQKAIAHPAPQPQTQGSVTTQLFWSADGNFSEECSARISLPPDQETPLRFVVPATAGDLHFRFDPADKPGLIRIAAIRVRRMKKSDSQMLFSASERWDALIISPNVLRLADSPELNLLGLDHDPSVALPKLELGTEVSDIVFEVWVQHRSSLQNLPNLLSGPTLPDARVVRDLQATADQAQGRLAAFAAQQEDVVRELSTRTAEVEALRARIASLEADVHAGSARETEGSTRAESDAQRLRDEAGQTLQSAMDQRQTELDALREQLIQREQSHASLQESLHSISSERDAATLELQKLQLKLGDVEARMGSEAHDRKLASEAVQSLQASVAQRQAELDALHTYVADREQIILSLQDSARQTATQRDAARLEATALRERLAGLDVRILTESESRRLADETIQTLQASINQRQAELDAGRTQLAQREQSYTQLQETLRSITGQRDATAAEVQHLRQRLGEIEARIGTEANARRLADEAAQALHGSLEQRQRELNTLQNQLAEREASLAACQHSVEESAFERESVAEIVASLRAQVADLQGCAQGESAARRLSDESAQAMQALVAQRQSELEALQTRLLEREAALETLQSTLAEHVAQRDTMQAELASARAQVQEAQDQAAAESAARRLADETGQSLRLSVEQRQEELEALQAELAVRQQDADALQTRLQQITLQRDAASTDADALRGQVAELESRIIAEVAARRLADESTRTLQASLAQRQMELDTRQTELAASQHTVASLQTSLEEGNLQRDVALAEAETQRTQIGELESRILAEAGARRLAEDSVRALQTSLDQQQVELNALRVQLGDRDKAAGDLEVALEAVRNQRADVAEELETTRHQLAKLEERLAGESLARAEADELVQSLQKSSTGTKEELRDLRAHLERSERASADLEVALIEVTGRYNSTSADLQVCESRLAQARVTLASETALRAESAQSLRALMDELDEAKKAVAALEHDSEMLTRENAHLQTKVHNAIATIGQLEAEQKRLSLALQDQIEKSASAVRVMETKQRTTQDVIAMKDQQILTLENEITEIRRRALVKLDALFRRPPPS